MRVGFGYDVHPLVKGRPLVLGGATIPHSKGLGGWSDADVLTHAVMDALLGAAALGDIGGHFPPGDPQYQNISSLLLLAKVSDELVASGWHIVNIDATIVAEKPQLSDFIAPIRLNLSRTMGIAVGLVSVKAKTTNGLGFVGREEGIAAHAVVLLEGRQDEGH